MTNLTLAEAIQKYIELFDAYEKIAYKIAKQNLESSFDIEKSIIPISKEGVILNGSHRLACSIKNNVKLVPCIRLKINSPKYES